MSRLDHALAAFPPRLARGALGAVQYRESGRAPRVTHVLLHGIGSASGSWLRQLQAAQDSDAVRVLAWDAPGYGASDALPVAAPGAADYAARLWDWLDVMDIRHPVVLAGHSLGALMGASAAASQPARVSRLVLLSPARGYGNASADERDKRLNDRLATLAELGPQGIAEKRGGAMLAPGAAPELVAYVRAIMAAIRPDGYTQAARMLAGGVLGGDVARVRALGVPIAVASGAADTITPPAGCQAVAAEAGVPWIDLGDAGHACALQASERVNALLSLPQPHTHEALA